MYNWGTTLDKVERGVDVQVPILWWRVFTVLLSPPPTRSPTQPGPCPVTSPACTPFITITRSTPWIPPPPRWR